MIWLAPPAALVAGFILARWEMRSSRWRERADQRAFADALIALADDYRTRLDRSEAERQSGVERLAASFAEYTERLTTLRQGGFVEGGGRTPPPEEPLPSRLEAFILDLEPDAQDGTRAWCRERLERGLPETTILHDLENYGDLILSDYGA